MGNIPREASEDDIRMIFQRFGQIVRFRMHSHPVKSWIPRYAFVTYETIDAVQECLKKRVSKFPRFAQFHFSIRPNVLI